MKRIDIDVKRLKKLYNNGMTQEEIAKVLNCSRGTIIENMKLHNLKCREHSKRNIGFNIPKKEIEKLYNKGHSQDKIANILGCCVNVIRNRMRKYNINIHKAGSWVTPKYIITKQSLRELYNGGQTQGEIAEIYGCSDETIASRMRGYNIPVRPLGIYRHNEPFELTKYLREIINGELLGDGSLSKSIGNKNSSFTYATSNRKYLEWLINELSILNFSPIRKVLQIRWNKNISFMTYSERNIVLTKLYNKWYKNNIKHIPSDLILTPTACRGWYIGDGCLNNNRRNNCITLATHSFSKDEQEQILLPQLNKLGLEAKLHKAGYNKIGKQRYVIYIPKRSIIKFLNYIGPCPVKSYEYKWRSK